MKIIIATDIHGINDELRALFQDLGQEIKFLSPWPGEGSPYDNEQEAVAAFQAANGLEKYQQQIAKETDNAPAILIGFSVGATALWLHSSSQLCHPQSRAHLYYEASFQPANIIANLTHPHVNCTIIAGTRHGFMNPHSPNFREDLAQQEVATIRRLREEQSQ